jgi:hypothetical protein
VFPLSDLVSTFSLVKSKKCPGLIASKKQRGGISNISRAIKNRLAICLKKKWIKKNEVIRVPNYFYW